MAMKKPKVCANKNCTNTFKQFKTTDKYCSSACFYARNKSKPKKHKPIKLMAAKRKKESLLYAKKRKTFLAKDENRYCPVAKSVYKGLINIDETEFEGIALITDEYYIATEIHHKAGRKGKLLNYVPHWLAVSRMGHLWIHANPTKAYELGLLIKPSTINIT